MQTPREPVWIQVDMEVTRYQEFPEDGGIMLFGYVGDYEVSVSLPLDDERVKMLRRPKARRPARGG